MRKLAWMAASAAMTEEEVSARDGTSDRWPAQVPFGGVLIGPADAQRGRLVIGTAGDLKRRRQPLAVEAVRQCDTTEFEEIAEAREVRRRRLLIDLVDGNRCRHRGGRE